MNGPVRQNIVNGPQQQNLMAMNHNLMQPPSIPNMPHLAQQGLPGQPRYPGMPQQVPQALQQQQQRQLSMARPPGQPPLGFNPASLMTQAQLPVRRVPSQPHMNVGLQGQMPMRPPQNIQQVQQQQRQLELARQQQAQQQQGLVRTPSNSQVMSSLNGPLGTHMQSSNQHQQPSLFQPAQQHMGPQISAPPRQPTGLGMPGSMSLRGPMPEDFAFPASQFNMGSNMQPRQSISNPANGMFPFGSSSTMSNPASTPPPGMQMQDLTQGGSPGSIAGGTPNRNSIGGFLPTSPSQFDGMSNPSADALFNMPPPNNIPPRPASHGAPMSQQPLQAQQAQQQQAQQRQQQLQQHQQLLAQGGRLPGLSMSMAIDPMNPASLNAMGMGQMQPQRPQSQPQSMMGMGMSGMQARPPSQASNNPMSAMSNGANNGGVNVPRPPSTRSSPNHMQMTPSNSNAPSTSNNIPNTSNTNPSNPTSSLSPPGPSTSTIPRPPTSGPIGNPSSSSSSVIASGTPLTATGRLPNATPGALMPSMPPNSASSSSGNFPSGSMPGMMPIAPRPPSSMRGSLSGPPSNNSINNPGAPGNLGGNNPQALGPQTSGDQQRQNSQPPQPTGANAGPRGPPGMSGPPNMMHPQNGPMHGMPGHSGMPMQPGAHPTMNGMPMMVPPGGQVMGAHNPNSGIGHGQGLMRLLQFSGILAQNDTKKKLDPKWWAEVVKEYFQPTAVMKFTLWRDSQRIEAKPFEIGVRILPRFFLVTTQSGVKSMALSLDGARERFFGAGHSVIECVHAQWTYRYTNGYCVVLRGPLTVHVIITEAPRDPTAPHNPRGQPTHVLKFEEFQFDANSQEKFICVDNISGIRLVTQVWDRQVHPWIPAEGHSPSLGPITAERQAELDHAEAQRWEEHLVKIEDCEIPGEPVNAFGIPQATMRCLELEESVMSMETLIDFAEHLKRTEPENQVSAMEALGRLATHLRDTGQVIMPLKEPKPFFSQFQDNHEELNAAVGQQLHTDAIGYVHYPDGSKKLVKTVYEASMLTRSYVAPSSPEKQIKAESQPPQTPSVAASPAISSGGTTNNTPALSNATLKRKNPSGAEATSPVVGNPESSSSSGSKARTAARKRNRTQPT